MILKMKTRHYLLLLALVSAAFCGGYLLNKGLASKSGVVPETPAPRKGLVWFGYVDLRHGPTGLQALQPGRVTKVLVKENETVYKDAPLLEMDDALARLRVQEASAALDMARKKFSQAQKLPGQMNAKLAQQRHGIAAFDHRILAALALNNIKKDLFKRSLVNQEEVIASDNQVKELKALREVEKQKLAELNLIDPHLKVDIARKQMERAQALLDQAEQARRECTLRAPEAGTVLRILVNPGEVLGVPGKQAPLIFAPAGPRIIRAEVEQEFAGRVQIGQHVEVEDDTDVTRIGEGKISSVSNWFLPRRFALEDPSRLVSGRTLECIVSLDPGHGPLRIGQRVRIRVSK